MFELESGEMFGAGCVSDTPILSIITSTAITELRSNLVVGSLSPDFHLWSWNPQFHISGITILGSEVPVTREHQYIELNSITQPVICPRRLLT